MGNIKDIQENISQVIVGKDETVLLTVVAMIAGGHVLLEDVPGTGKTVLAKSLARTVDGTFKRIQFTPDLLPSDITGLNVYQMSKGEFVFNKGPVFCNILLADEINRATPRTQAGLLECMEEKQVTIDGATRELERPFFVIATQNPVETSGTFPLPEAQLDRFLMKLSVGFPDRDEELKILERFDGGSSSKTLEKLSAVVTLKEIEDMHNEAMKVSVHPHIRDYIVDIIMATRNRRDVASGVSTRGSLALLNCAKVLAYAEGRDYVVPEDVKRLAIPVLAHRLILASGYGINADASGIIQSILDEISVPTEVF